jgi:A/G-specific adenine glycosylase
LSTDTTTLPEFSRYLLEWYEANHRDLPWRGETDSYKIWVSEIMLQQTRIETVIPYYQRWIQRFPNLPDLAQADEQAVLRAWEGLGYYSRARNLHRAARLVMQNHHGKLPADVRQLQQLPGIGRYTAGAIASIAFGIDAPALDGNIKRVLARVFNMPLPIDSPQGLKTLWQLADDHLPPGRAGDHNQALMDLGAVLCTPRKPACAMCPLKEICQAVRLGMQEQLPVKKASAAVPQIEVTAAVILQNGKVLITRRPSKGLLGGLWEFPGGKREDGESLADCLQRELREELAIETSIGEPFGEYKHAYTHFRVRLFAFHCTITQGEPQLLHASQLQWAALQDLGSFPMGKIDRQIARRLADSNHRSQ